MAAQSRARKAEELAGHLSDENTQLAVENDRLREQNAQLLDEVKRLTPQPAKKAAGKPAQQ